MARRKKHHRRPGLLTKLGRKLPSAGGSAIQAAGGVVIIGAVAAGAAQGSSQLQSGDIVGGLAAAGQGIQNNVPQMVGAAVIGTVLVILGSVVKRAARGGLV